MLLQCTEVYLQHRVCGWLRPPVAARGPIRMAFRAKKSETETLLLYCLTDLQQLQFVSFLLLPFCCCCLFCFWVSPCAFGSALGVFVFLLQLFLHFLFFFPAGASLTPAFGAAATAPCRAVACCCCCLCCSCMQQLRSPKCCFCHSRTSLLLLLQSTGTPQLVPHHTVLGYCSCIDNGSLIELFLKIEGCCCLQ